MTAVKKSRHKYIDIASQPLESTSTYTSHARLILLGLTYCVDNNTQWKMAKSSTYNISLEYIFLLSMLFIALGIHEFSSAIQKLGQRSRQSKCRGVRWGQIDVLLQLHATFYKIPFNVYSNLYSGSNHILHHTFQVFTTCCGSRLLAFPSNTTVHPSQQSSHTLVS